MSKKTNSSFILPPSSFPHNPSSFIIYETEDGRVKLEVRLQNETVWLTQTDMARLFQCSADNISLHLKNIYDEGELQSEATAEDFSVVRQEGTREVRRTLTFYNLDAIISVGYRVKSHVATRFRIWATQRLKEYIIKGFTLDDERLKNPDQPFDYFEELTRRIQDIRTSERRFYQKITDIRSDFFKRLEDDTYFKQVRLFFTGIGWPEGQDLGPDTIEADLQTV